MRPTKVTDIDCIMIPREWETTIHMRQHVQHAMDRCNPIVERSKKHACACFSCRKPILFKIRSNRPKDLLCFDCQDVQVDGHQLLRYMVQIKTEIQSKILNNTAPLLNKLLNF